MGSVAESVGPNGPLAWVSHAPARRFINTVASARCNEAPGALQPFSTVCLGGGKPLKRLGWLAAFIHRAKAAVLMRWAPGMALATGPRGGWMRMSFSLWTMACSGIPESGIEWSADVGMHFQALLGREPGCQAMARRNRDFCSERAPVRPSYCLARGETRRRVTARTFLSASGELPRSADKNVRAPTRDLNSYLCVRWLLSLRKR